MIPPCLTLSNIRYVSRVKWSNPGKGVAPSSTPWCSRYWKVSLLVALDNSRQIYWLFINSNGTVRLILQVSRCYCYVGTGLTTDRRPSELSLCLSFCFSLLKRYGVFYTSAIPKVTWYEPLYNNTYKQFFFKIFRST